MDVVCALSSMLGKMDKQKKRNRFIWQVLHYVIMMSEHVNPGKPCDDPYNKWPIGKRAGYVDDDLCVAFIHVCIMLNTG